MKRMIRVAIEGFLNFWVSWENGNYNREYKIKCFSMGIENIFIILTRNLKSEPNKKIKDLHMGIKPLGGKEEIPFQK